MCQLLTAGVNCTQTYAEYLGSSFTSVTIGFSVLTFFLSVLTFGFTYSVFKQSKSAFDSQKAIWVLGCLMCLTLIIRCPDLEGFVGTEPYWFNSLVTDLGTTIEYSIVFTFLRKWVCWICFFSGRDWKTKIDTIFVVLNVVVWLSFIPLSLLQALDDRVWMWRGAKLFVGAIALTTIVVLQTAFGYRIFEGVRKTERDRTVASGAGALDPPQHNRQLSAEPLRMTRDTSPNSLSDEYGSPVQSSSSHSPRNDDRKSMSFSRSYAAEHTRTQQDKDEAEHIRRLLIIYGVGMTAVIIAQFYTAFKEFSDQPTRSTDVAPPSTTLDLLYALIFDVIHLIAMILIVIFFRPKLSELRRGDNKPTTPHHERNNSQKMSGKHSRLHSQVSMSPSQSRRVEWTFRVDDEQDKHAAIAMLMSTSSTASNSTDSLPKSPITLPNSPSSDGIAFALEIARLPESPRTEVGCNTAEVSVNPAVSVRIASALEAGRVDTFESPNVVVESTGPTSNQPNGNDRPQPDDWQRFETEQGLPFYYSERRRKSEWEVDH